MSLRLALLGRGDLRERGRRRWQAGGPLILSRARHIAHDQTTYSNSGRPFFYVDEAEDQ